MNEVPRSYEEKAERLEGILTRLDNSETPIDELAKDVKEGVRLIKEMSETLRKVEIEVKEAFKELEDLQQEQGK
jgi:exodeoxyribonuclease VII small subunit